MRWIILRLGLFCLAGILQPTFCQGQAADTAQSAVDIQAWASPDSVYPGEAVQLAIQVQHYEESMGTPTLPELSGSVTLISQQDRSEHRIQIVNGKQQVTGFSGRVFVYRILPDKPGPLVLGPIHIEDTQGQIITTRGPTVSVKPIPEQDFVSLELEGPSGWVVPDEPFSITLWLRIRRLPPPYAQSSPIPRGTAPLLGIPYLDWTEEMDIKSPNLSQMLQQKLVTQGEAFRINNRRLAQNGISLLQREQPAWFRLDRDIDPDDDRFFRYKLTTSWVASREKPFVFGPVRFHGPVITHVNREGRVTTENIYAVSEPLTVHVTLPPDMDRPDNWIGASGRNLHIKTSLDTQTCFMGDPLTLSIDITGETARHRIRPPAASVLAPLTNAFRMVGEPRTKDLPDGKRFSYLIRPYVAGTLEIPALPISYFDLDTRSYQTVRSQPLPVRVNAVKDFSPLAGTDALYPTNGLQQLAPAPIRAMQTQAYRMVHPLWHSLLLLVGPLLLLLHAGQKLQRRYAPRLAQRRTTRQAAHQATQRLQQILATNTPCEQAELASIMRTYLAHRFDPALRAATATEAKNKLAQHQIPPARLQQVAQYLSDAVYAPSSQIQMDHVRDLLHLIQEIDSAASRRKHNASTMLLLLGACLCAGTQAGAAPSDARRNFETQRAHTALLQAQTASDFLQAAEAHATRITLEGVSPDSFYHLGTALLLAGHPKLAIVPLQRAERLGGSRWDIRRNLLLALRAADEAPTRQLPWYRIPLFWHYRLGIFVRISSTAILFSLLCLCWFLRLQGFAHMNRYLLPLLLLFLLLCGSLCTSFYAEWQDTNHHALLQNQIEHLLAQTQEDLPAS